MARYVTLLRFSPSGAQDIKKSVSRAAAFKKAAEKAGVTVETQVWTTGAYDGVLILSGDEKSVLGSIAQLAALGNVQTESLQAFDADAFKAITG
jgi:uncharacterized protein with GYD domain